MRRPLAVQVMTAVLSIVLGSASTLEACTCNELTFEQHVASASSIFTARVTSIQPGDDGLGLIVTMTPIQRWKGGLVDPVQVRTGEDKASCGVVFFVGLEYLVFADTIFWSGQERYFTDSCTRTRLAFGNPDIPNLGPPLAPTAVRSVTWGRVKCAWR